MTMGSWMHAVRITSAACALLLGSAAFGQAPDPLEASVASLEAAYAQSVAPSEQADHYRELFAPVLRRVQRSYVTEVDLQAFTAAALKAMQPGPSRAGSPGEVFSRSVNAALATLDGYSRYTDAQRGESASSESGDSFVGVGIEVEPGDGGVRVVAPIPGGPAERAGLKGGDLILKVDDQPLQALPLGEAISRMRGASGTPVSLTVRRTGASDDFTVSVTRDTIRRQPLRWRMEGDVLVLRVSGFTRSTTSSVQEAIARASAETPPRGVVLDLRGNPGGLLREAVTLADTFLSQGTISSLQGRTPGNQRRWQADAAELLPGVPMAVLVDRRSASASELVAAALQENGRAIVMGQRSYGKGTVQSVFTLGDEGGTLKLTTAHYLSPSGHAVQTAGVAPDIELLGPSMPRRGGAADEAALTRPPRAQTEAERCARAPGVMDMALACALAYVRAGTLEAFAAGLAPAPH